MSSTRADRGQMSAIKDAGATFGTRVWSPASSCSAAAEKHANEAWPSWQHLSPWAQLVLRHDPGIHT